MRFDDWIPPPQWEKAAFKRLAEVLPGDSRLSSSNKGSVPLLGANGEIGRSSEANLYEPAVIIGRVGSAGSINQITPPVWVSDNALISKARSNSNLRFLTYVLETLELGADASDTAQPLITQTQVNERVSPLPPLETQRAIADYLDIETARIDALIAKKQQLIHLFEERSRSMAAHTLHRNSDGQVTNIPSMPFVPSEWQVLRNKVFMSESSVLSVDGREEMLSVSHLTGVTPRSQKTVHMFEAESTIGYKTVKPGDLVINTMWAWMGAAGVSSYAGIVSPAYGVYAVDTSVVYPPWLDLVIRSQPYIVEMTRFSRGVTSSRLRLYPEEFLQLRCPVPSFAEQKRLVGEFQRYYENTVTLALQIGEQLNLLKEKRQALITAAVTGEFQVPGAA